ncbi:TPA: TcdA/TcdB catalytic glycosyltransferase domain-containing protein [Providencia alcalifaciens]
MRINSISTPSQQETNTIEKFNSINRNNEEKITHEPFINRITKVKNTSTDEAIAIGKLIQEEIRKTINPTSPPPVSTTGNWKSAIIHRLGLLMSGDTSQIPLIDSNNAHQQKFTSVIPQTSSLSFSAPVHHLYNEQSSTTSISPKQYLKAKKIKKRSLDNINQNNVDTKKNDKLQYSLSKDNIENKIFNNIQNKKTSHHSLLETLKESINSYKNLSNKNSREGIELLKEQANSLAKLYETLNEKSNNENFSSERSNILSIINEIQNEYLSHTVEVEKHIHVVWVAGAPPESLTKYAQAYKNAYPDFNFNLWIDPNSMSAYLFNKEIKEIAFENAKNEVINSLTEQELEKLKTTTDLTPEFNEKLKSDFEYHLLSSTLQLQDAVMNFAYTKGLLNFNDKDRIDFLRNILLYSEEKIKTFQKSLYENTQKLHDIEDKLANIFGSDKIRLYNINNLPEMKQVHSKHHYQRELILRGNYAAATDQLRAYILKNHGGIYTDPDVSPAYTSKVYQIIENNSNNYDFLEKETLCRAVNDELLSLVSNEPSAGIKEKLSIEDKKRLESIISDIKKEEKIFEPIDTKVIRDSLLMSKRHQWWGPRKGWNDRGNNNFLVTHKGSKVLDYIISNQEKIYREILGIREQLRFDEIGEQRYYYNPENKHHELLRGREKVEAKLFVSGLDSKNQKTRKKEELKKIKKYLKEYGNLLKADTTKAVVKDIRASNDFLNGYRDADAINNVAGFKDEMNIKEIVELMKKNRTQLNDKQMGELAYEVERRALSITFQPMLEEYHQLFDKVTSSGDIDKYATKKLMPQLFILNLSGDGFGGRCDPLSILILVEKYLQSIEQQKVSGKLLENLYSAAAVLSEPTRYTEIEIKNAKQLLLVLSRLHAKNPMHSTQNIVWKNKEGNIKLTEVLRILNEKGTEPVLLKLETPGHAMAAWSVNSGDVRVYGFYDANGGVFEFSDENKFREYFLGIFSKEGLDKGNKYKLTKDSDNNELMFNRVVSINGEALANYKTSHNEKPLKDIFNVEIFESRKKTIKKQNEKIKFSPNKYKNGSLFSHYRMDGIISQKYSTLYITGPDAMMMSIKKYYESLGILGQCRLDQHNNKFKGLADDSFVGNLEEVSSSSGKHYDWVNPKTVGINDITPDDDSTWIGKQNNIEEIFSKIKDNKQTEGMFGITPTKINIKKLMIGWPSDIKEKILSESPNFESDYNKFISEDILDLNKLSAIDKKIHQHLLSSRNDLVKWAGISLSDQLTEKLKKSNLPIGNNVHYFLSDIESNPEAYKKSISSIILSSNNVDIIVWANHINDEKSLRNKLGYTSENKIKIRTFSRDLKKSPLISAISNNEYHHEDKNKILAFAILSQEPGIIIRNAAIPAPSRELMNIILDHTGGNNADVKHILHNIYEYLFGNGEYKFSLGDYEQALKITFNSILEKIDTKNIGKYFSSIMNLSSSYFGLKFSSADGSFNSDVMLSGIKNEHIDNNVNLHGMEDFLSLIYEIKNDIKEKKNLTLDLIKSKFQHQSLYFMLQNDSRIDDFIKKTSTKNDMSLTEITKGLTGKQSFIECATQITMSKFPSITRNLLKEIELQNPSIYSISDNVLIEPEKLRGLGDANSDSYISNPILTPKLHDVSITAKYQTLQWGDFYSKNALLWQDTATEFEGRNIKFHPQMLLTPQEGRCMGLAELYLLANTETHYDTLQANLDLASALYQDNQNKHSQLSESDKHLLAAIQYQIEHAQQHGNSKLLHSPRVNKIKLSDFETQSVAKYLINNNITKLLITTKFHGIIISNLNGKCRVTDPNFGYVDFDNLEKALIFTEKSINISPEIHHLYTGGDANTSIDINFVLDNDWSQIVSYDALELTSHPYQSTLEKISTLQTTISIKNKKIPLIELHKFGVTVDGKRIDEKNINEIDDASNKLKINGDLLDDYINKHHLNEGEVSTIHHLLSSLEHQSNTQKVKLSEVIAGPSAPMSLLVRLERQRNKLATFLTSELKKMSMTLTNNGVDLSSSKTKIIGLKLDKSSNEIDLSLQTHQRKTSVKLDVSTIGLSLKEGFDALQEGFDAMHLDEILSVLGIMQYAKMAATGERLTSLDHANHVSDLKTLFDSALGLTLIAVGEKSFGTSVSQIKLETIVATKLQHIATKFRGVTGSLLTKAATVIKLPILDTALNLWSLGDAIQTYLNPNISSEVRLLAGVDIGFATTYTSLSLLSTVFPPLALSTIPIYFFQQEVKNILQHNHHIEVRRKAWLSLERYLNESSKVTFLAKPEKQLLDLSPNKLLGGVTIDLRVSPPKFDAYRSYNHGKGFGNHADLNDQQVKARSGYATACTSTLDIPEMHVFESVDKVICNDNAKHEYQLAKGYANRLWPPTFPKLPQGDYTTVILGYSARITAYTEAIRMDDGTYKELARTDHVLMHKDHKSTIITCSDNFTTFAIPPLEQELFLLKNQDILHTMKESWFTLRGGKNGMILHTNGIGNVEFQGQPHTQNILSFKNLGQGFSVHVDLNKNTRQTVVHSLLPYLTHHSSKMMDLIQNNINTLIGSDHGYDTFIGNQHDNHFILGAIGGTVHLKGGNNVVEIPVPGTKNKVYRTNINLSPNSGMQYLKFKGGIKDIHHIIYNDDSIYIFFEQNRGLDAKKIEIHAHKDGNFSEYVNKLIFSTEDGLNLKLTEDKNTFTLESVNMTSWRNHHKNNELNYELIINSLYEKYCKKNTCVFFDEFMKIFVTNKNIECIINKPDSSFEVPTNYSSVIYGEAGGHYISNAISSVSTTIVLKNSLSKIERIDISPSLVPLNGEKIVVYAKASGDNLIITVHKGTHKKEYTLLSSDSSKLNLSLSRLEFSSKEYLTLLDIYKLVSTSQGNVLIFECN